jgi:hypothetical protein
MNKYFFYLMILVIIVVLTSGYEYFTNTKQINYSSSCKYVPELLGKVMKERNMVSNNNNYDYYIPCSYNTCEKDILLFENIKTGKKVYSIDGCDWIASKLALWRLLLEEYGSNASKYMPTTHLLEDKNDIQKFPEHFRQNKLKNSNQMYVLKNYAQRQEGIKLTRNLDEIMNGLKKGWYLVQDYVYNPFIIDKRKINFRYYLLIICRNNNIEGYIHKNGFVYYTPEFYDPNDMDFKKHITTGYIDRAVYDKNPLTLQDFRNYLNDIQLNLSTTWDNSVNNLMNKTMNAISKKICKNNKLNNHVRFQLFGADVAPDANLGCTLMEINKGPDLGAKDERDKQVKLKVQKDIFTMIENDDVNDSEFIKIF